ncbi:hypothetical protein R2601_04358 [Salipiger bermudensis HTCC2601]|uniref:Uncharacterized protein n=1 Tax=Salipiger bermudensis (strain DSM 26914 / JCM 13377 / KCTC 12554 / HTCC2601) TaxID=314265 RepID=Q0FVX4_SALBH|nr:hypothetical protein R2601_04358 [Salipiger bermudensis HTCC2601]
MLGAAQLHEGHDAEPQLPPIQVGLVALDDAAFLEPLEPPPARGLAHPERVGEAGIGHPPVLLQQGEDAGARGVDLGHGQKALELRASGEDSFSE